HADPQKEPLLERLLERYPPHARSRQPAAEVLRTREPVLLPEISAELLRDLTEDAEHLRLVETLGAKTALAVPLIARGQLLGVITMASGAPAPPFGPDDLELAEEV